MLAHNARFKEKLYGLVAGFVEAGENLENAVAERAAAIISAKDLFIHACETCGLTEEMFHACVLEKEEMAALTAEDTELKARKKMRMAEKI